MRAFLGRHALRAWVVSVLSLLASVPSLHAQATVTPKGSADPNRIQHTTGHGGLFTVTNTTPGTSGSKRFFTFTCGGTGTAVCDSVRPVSDSILNNGGTRIVTAWYRVGNTGTGLVWTVAQASTPVPPARDSGWRAITAIPPIGAPVVDFTPYLADHIAADRCAASCFTATHAQSTVPYFTVDAARRVTLVYQGDRVAPRAFFHVNLQPDPTFGSFPTEYRFALFVGALQVPFVQGENLLRFAYPGNPTQAYRIGGQIPSDTLTAYSHGVVYPVSLRVSSVIGGTTYTNRFDTQYLSINEQGSVIARGWTVAGHQRLYVQADGSLLATDGTGNVTWFKKLTATTWSTPPGDFSVMRTLTSPTRFVRAYPDSLKVYFNVNGFADSVKDRFGNRTWYQYDAQSRLRYIWDPAMQLITLSYGTNGLATITDANGRNTNLTVVAGSRNLSHITDPDGVSTQFGYDGGGRLTTVTDRAGATTTLAWNTLSHSVTSITAPAVPIFNVGTVSPVTTLASWQVLGVPYVATSSTPFPPVRADTAYARVTDPEGHLTRFTVDRWGQPARTVDALGQVTTIRYTAAGLPDSVVRPGYGAGDYDRMAYDASGLLLTSKPAGGDTTRITYGAWAEPVSVVRRGIQTMTFGLGPNGSVDTVKVGGTTVQRVIHDARGRPTTIIDGTGVASQTLFYQPAGYQNTDSMKVPGNRRTRYVRDLVGRVAIVLDPMNRSTTTAYDHNTNRVTSVLDAAGWTTTYTYNNLYLTQVTLPGSVSYQFGYNALGWPIWRKDPKAVADTFLYDRDGQLRRHRNRRRLSVDRTYDVLHRAVTQKGTDSLSWTYANGGRIVTARSFVAPSTLLSRDSITANLLGNPMTAITTLGGQTFTRTYLYTPAGLLDSMFTTGPTGMPFVGRKYVYDTNKGTLSTFRVDGRTIAFGLDNNLNLINLVYPNSAQFALERGSLQAPIKQTTEAGNNFLLERWLGINTLGQIDRHMRNTAKFARWFTYDSLGQLNTGVGKQRIPDGIPLGCPTPDFGMSGTCSPDSAYVTLDSTRYQYDAYGNRLDKGGVYDATGTRISVFDTCAYTTDADGNTTSRVNPINPPNCAQVLSSLTWNAEGQLRGVTMGGGPTLAYYYDGFGRLIRKDSAGAAVSHFLWNGDELLAELGGATTTKRTEYAYQPGLDRPVAIFRTVLVGMTLRNVPYFTRVDGLGNVIALTDTTNTIRRLYAYEDFGALTTSPTDTIFLGRDRVRWKGALWLGPEIDLYWMRARWYEGKSGRFLSEDPMGLDGGSRNVFAFASNDPANGRDPSGLAQFCVTRGYHFYNESGAKIATLVTGHACWETGPGEQSELMKGMGGQGGGTVSGAPATDEAGPSCTAAVGGALLSAGLDVMGGGLKLAFALPKIANATARLGVARGLFSEARVAAAGGDIARHHVLAGAGFGVGLLAQGDRALAQMAADRAVVGITARGALSVGGADVPTVVGGVNTARGGGSWREIARNLPISGTVIRGIEAGAICGVW